MSFIEVIAGLAVAGVLGWWLNRRAGVLRTVRGDGADDAGGAAFLGLLPGVPTVVHFSAPWCGPCGGLRRIVEKVCSDLGDVPHREIDIDANPAAAQRFSVMSLPTTLIFDADGRQRFRVAGVPTAGALRAALEPLLA